LVSVLGVRSQDHGITGGSNPNPLERQAKKLLGLLDVVLAVDRQLIVASAVGDGGFPAWHGDVLHGEAVKLEDAGRVVV